MNPIRGMQELNGRLFVVAGPYFCEVYSNAMIVVRGQIGTRSGPVDFDSNTFQVGFVDGSGGYAFTVANNTFQPITSGNFPAGAMRLKTIGGRGVLVDPHSQTWRWTAIDDFLTIDPLDFDLATSKPDQLVAPFPDHGNLLLFGMETIEVWTLSDANTFARAGVTIESGTISPFSIAAIDNAPYWIENSENGAGIVRRLNGYTPQRVSNQFIEESLKSVSLANLRQARAWTCQLAGKSLYVLQVPGLDTTLVLDVRNGEWHEISDFRNGEHIRHRAQCHAYAFGKHLVGGDDGKIYEMDPEADTNAGDPLVRDRIFRSNPQTEPQPMNFARGIEIDCLVGAGKDDGTAPLMQLRYSNDSGASFGSWKEHSLGVVGQRSERVRFRMCGYARDVSKRVFHVRMSDAAHFAIFGARIP